MTTKTDNKIALTSDQRATQYKGIFEKPAVQHALAATLPKHLKPERIIRVTLAAMQTNPKLLECTPNTVLRSVLLAAAMGLEPDGGPLGQGYLVPFWNGRHKRLDCQFIPGYRGLIKLARNSGEVADVQAEVVYEGDEFDYALGLEPKLVHKPNDQQRGELQYAYAVARFRDGEKKFTVLNKLEIEAIKASSASKNKAGEIVGPWADWPAEMWKKTAIRRLCKTLPLSVEVRGAIEADGETELPQFELLDLGDEVIEGEPTQQPLINE